MTLESRMVIPNMMAEFGVKNAYLQPDEKVFEYLAERLARRLTREGGKPVAPADVREGIVRGSLYPDPDATYIETFTVDANEIELMISCPHTVDNAKPLREVKGTKIHQAFLGTCTNGRLEDIAIAADIVKGKQVAKERALLDHPRVVRNLYGRIEAWLCANINGSGRVVRYTRLRTVHGQSSGRSRPE